MGVFACVRAQEASGCGRACVRGWVITAMAHVHVGSGRQAQRPCPMRTTWRLWLVRTTMAAFGGGACSLIRSSVAAAVGAAAQRVPTNPFAPAAAGGFMDRAGELGWRHLQGAAKCDCVALQRCRLCTRRTAGWPARRFSIRECLRADMAAMACCPEHACWLRRWCRRGRWRGVPHAD